MCSRACHANEANLVACVKELTTKYVDLEEKFATLQTQYVTMFMLIPADLILFFAGTDGWKRPRFPLTVL